MGAVNSIEYIVYHNDKWPLVSIKKKGGCDECDSILIHDRMHGELVCSKCGLVHDLVYYDVSKVQIAFRR